MAFSIKLFIMGLVILTIGIVLIIKNKRISSGYQKGLSKVTKSKSLESKGVGTYIRIRYYVGGIILIILGAVLILVSFV